MLHLAALQILLHLDRISAARMLILEWQFEKAGCGLPFPAPILHPPVTIVHVVRIYS